MAFGYNNKLPIYPIFYLLKRDYTLHGVPVKDSLCGAGVLGKSHAASMLKVFGQVRISRPRGLQLKQELQEEMPASHPLRRLTTVN